MEQKEIEKEIVRLQKEIEELKKVRQNNDSVWHRNLVKVVFYGAVASGITSIANLIIATINLVKKG